MRLAAALALMAIIAARILVAVLDRRIITLVRSAMVKAAGMNSPNRNEG